MNWYIAKLVFRIVCGEGNHQPQFDEQLRLISAGSNDEALEKAYAIIEREQSDFLNAAQQTVRWEFINLTELYKTGELVDGAELHYTIVEVDNAEAYIETTHQKASLINGRSIKELISAS